MKRLSLVRAVSLSLATALVVASLSAAAPAQTVPHSAARATGNATFRAAIDNRRTLQIDGTDAPESIVVTVNGGTRSVGVVYRRSDGRAAPTATFALTAFDTLSVRARGGADFVNIIDAAQVLEAGKKRLNLDGGEGNNIVVASHAPFNPQTATRIRQLLSLSRQVENLANRAAGATAEALSKDALGLVDSSRVELADEVKALTADAETQLLVPAKQLVETDLPELWNAGEAINARAEDLVKRQEALAVEHAKKYDPTDGVYPPEDNPAPAERDANPPSRPVPGPDERDAEATRARTRLLTQEALQLGDSAKAEIERQSAQIAGSAAVIEERIETFDARMQQLGAKAEKLAAQGETDITAAAGRVMGVLEELKVMERNFREVERALRGELDRTLTHARAADLTRKSGTQKEADCTTPITAVHTYAGGGDTDVFFPISAPFSSWSISGGGGSDILIGGMAADSIHGGDGADFICGLGGNDQIHGDAGTDVLFGDFIVDLSFITGNDCVQGGEGTDLAVGDNFFSLGGGTSGGDDIVKGDAGVDIVIGDDVLPDIFSQTLAGGKDKMEGGDDADIMLGCGGVDSIKGEDGMDFVQGNGGGDVIDGGGGKGYSFCNTTVELGNLLLGGNDGDTITGGSGIDAIFGNDGPDKLIGKDMVDLMFGGNGVDDMNGGHGGIICLIQPYNIPIRLGNFMVGGNDGDKMTAAGDLDIMLGLKGADDIRGYDNTGQMLGAVDADLLIGGDDADYIEGDKILDPVNLSTDVILGGPGPDVIDAGKNSDAVSGGPDADTIHGDNNWLPLIGSTDLIFGNGGPDWIDGGNSTDIIFGGDGNDTLWGDNETPGLISADVLFGQAGDDKMNGGDTSDFISGGTGDDNLQGDSNLVTQPLSKDFILAGSGNDYADGGNAMDFIFGETGSDRLLGDNSTNLTHSPDFIRGGPQDDDIDGGNDKDFVWGGDGHDKIMGDPQLATQLLSFDFLFGESGCDTIFGGRALDNIWGGVGVDQIHGQLGSDWIFGGGNSDIISGGDGPDFIWSNEGNDLVHGDGGPDFIDGGDGDDCLYGDNGVDFIMGDNGADCIRGGGGPDLLLGGNGDDLVFGDAGPDAIFGGDGDDKLDGGGGPDYMDGNGGYNDELWGGAGWDWLIGEIRHQKGGTSQDCNCNIEQCPGDLCITKFNDLNGNGVQDAGEPGLANWSFTVTGPNGTNTFVTGADGTACAAVPGGAYTVTEQPQNGWVPTTPTTRTVTVVSRQLVGVEFGNRARGKGDLCISKFNDLNGNGVQDGGETALAGWTFTVTGNGTSTTLVTGPTGNICSTLLAGTYTVAEQPQAGWTATTVATQTVTVNVGQVANVRFGNRRQDPAPGKGDLCISKFNDLNGNGVRDGGEPIMAGWTFTVTAANGTTTTLVTGPTGNVCMPYLAGNYSVTEQPQAGWTATTPATQTVTVMANQQNALNFGNQRPVIQGKGEICITKFRDKDRDGIQDAGELGLAGWTFTVTSTSGVVTTLVTGADGTICATYLAGTYTVTEQVLNGWIATTPITQTVTVIANQQTNLKFGNERIIVPANGTLCITKFNDKNRNGIQDAGESAIAGWTFTVTNAGGVNSTLVTAANGTICGTFPAGTYTVTEQPQAGWTATTPATLTVTVIANQQTNATFGNQRIVVQDKGELCIAKFNDRNGNGVQDAGETGLANWTFTVTGAGGGTVTLVTGRDGTVCGTFLVGTYTVSEQLQAGWTATTPITLPVTVVANQQARVTFGNQQREVQGKGELCILKFNDRNGNGVQDAGEPRLGNWTFTVTSATGVVTTIVTSEKDPVCATYPSGTYTVTEQPQAGWTATTPATQTVTVMANQQSRLAFGNRPK